MTIDITGDSSITVTLTAFGERYLIHEFVVLHTTADSALEAQADEITLVNRGVVRGELHGVFMLSDDGVIDNRAGAIIKADDGDGVFTGSGGVNLDIINDGTILSRGHDGVRAYFQAANFFLDNRDDGLVRGGSSQSSGVRVSSDGSLIENAGRIEGASEAGVFFDEFADGAHRVVNEGRIFGGLAGVAAFTNSGGETIRNGGLIDSDQHGVQVQHENPAVTTIVNLKGGTIRGDAASIATLGIVGFNLGRIDLDNRGTLDGKIDFAATGKDKVVNKGTIKGAVELGAGNDMFVASGGKSGTISGEAGVDRITAGVGRQVMAGGDGGDFFFFKALAHMAKTAAARDLILDFGANVDTIDLAAIDANGGASGHTFSWRGEKDFSGGKGQLRFEKFDSAGTANDRTIVMGDINGDRKADFHIELKGLVSLEKGDFNL